MKKFLTPLLILASVLIFSSSATADPDDPLIHRQWSLDAVNARAAWDLVKGDGSITIAVMDNGILSTHEDLRGALITGRDFTVQPSQNYRGEPSPKETHGTQVAGVAAAQANNGVGIASLAWNVKLMPLKVNGLEFLDEAYNYAAVHGADIVTNSVGFDKGVPENIAALRNAHQNGRSGKGVVLVKSSGNISNGKIFERRIVPEFILTGATNRDNIRATSFNSSWSLSSGKQSAYHTALDVVAPGAMIYTTSKNGEKSYGWIFQGTSYAAPLVAGLASLILTADPKLTTSQTQAIIQFTATDLNYVMSSHRSNKVTVGPNCSEKIKIDVSPQNTIGSALKLNKVIVKLNIKRSENIDLSKLRVSLRAPDYNEVILIERGNLRQNDRPESLLLRDGYSSVSTGVRSPNKLRGSYEPLSKFHNGSWKGSWALTIENADLQALGAVEWMLTCVYDNISADAAALDTEIGFEVSGPGRDKYTGYGLINAEKAVELAQAGRYTISASNGKHLASFDFDGNLVLEGDLNPGSSVAELKSRSEDVFHFGPASSSLARIDAHGNMWIAGGLTENKPHTVFNPPTDSFIFRNKSNVEIAYIDTSGNMVLCGKAFIAARPDRISSLELGCNPCKNQQDLEIIHSEN